MGVGVAVGDGVGVYTGDGVGVGVGAGDVEVKDASGVAAGKEPTSVGRGSQAQGPTGDGVGVTSQGTSWSEHAARMSSILTPKIKDRLRFMDSTQGKAG